MGIQNFPAALVPIIQQGYLERAFQDGLRSRLGFRAIADREEFSIGIGESLTKTRTGLKAPVTTPSNPANNTNLDNGMTPSGWTVEQYVMSLNQYNDTQDLNMVTSKVGIASQFLKNAQVNGIQAMQSLDRIARNTLYGSYLGGNTRVTATLGAPAATIAVDDIRGFRNVFSNGVLVPVSATNTMTVIVGASTYTLTTATADVTNVSTAPEGVSGTLAFSGNVTVADGTAGNAVVSSVAPVVHRPADRATTLALTSADTLTMQTILSGVADLRSNNVPDIDGNYNLYLDDKQLLGLFKDGDFKLLFRGAYGSSEYKSGMVFELLGARFIPTTEAPQQASLGAGAIHRGILCGAGALVEGDYAANGYSDVEDEDSLKTMVDDVCMVTREPLDRLQQIIAQSWYWIGGFAVPTDMTANTNVIPTATNSYYKRAVVLESV